MNQTMDAIYILSPLPHIVECLLADFERGRYKRGFLVWIGVPSPDLNRRLQVARQHIAGLKARRLGRIYNSWLTEVVRQVSNHCSSISSPKNHALLHLETHGLFRYSTTQHVTI